MNSKEFSFTKLHGLGNDFILIDQRQIRPPEGMFSPYTIQTLCHRHRGIGADGVIFLLPSTEATAAMRIFNAKGNEEVASGNGLRCAAKYLWEHGSSLQPGLVEHSPAQPNPTIQIQTNMGTLACKLGIHPQEKKISWIEVAMGTPKFLRKDIPMLGPPFEAAQPEDFTIHDQIFRLHPVSIGNPHVVIFLSEERKPLTYFTKIYGPLIEEAHLFPSRVNVGFARILDSQNIDLAVWERGSGLTQSSGTGACAAVASACYQGLLTPGDWVTVRLPGGELDIQITKDFGQVYLRGGAVEVFRGTLELHNFMP